MNKWEAQDVECICNIPTRHYFCTSRTCAIFVQKAKLLYFIKHIVFYLDYTVSNLALCFLQLSWRVSSLASSLFAVGFVCYLVRLLPHPLEGDLLQHFLPSLCLIFLPVYEPLAPYWRVPELLLASQLREGWNPVGVKLLLCFPQICSHCYNVFLSATSLIPHQ